MRQPGRLTPRPSLLTTLDRRGGLGRPALHDDRPSRRATTHEGSRHDLAHAGSDPTPTFEYELEFLAHLDASLSAEVIGDTPDGFRINFTVVRGTVRGPGIDAVVQPGGSDYMRIRPDGLGISDVDITYEAGDGALILNQSSGFCELGTECLARIRQGEFSGTAPFFVTPTWSTAAQKWKALNSAHGFGVGRALLDELRVEYDMYIPRLLGGRSA